MSIKNKNAKPANQVKPVQENTLTLDQHLKNVEIAVVNLKGPTFDEMLSIRNSFIFLKTLALKNTEEKFEKTDMK